MHGFKPTGKGPKSGHNFGSEFGFTGSAGQVTVRPHTRSSPIKKMHPHAAPMEAPPSEGRVDSASMGNGAMGASSAGGAPMAKGGNFIQNMHMKKGALHTQMGVPQGQKIPAKKLAAAAGKPGLLGKRARLAETLKGLHKKDGGPVHEDAAEDKKLIKSEVKKELHKADGGPVQEPKIHKLSESALVKRHDRLTNEDMQGGGTSNLRAGFAKGGKAAHAKSCPCAMCTGGKAGYKTGGTAHTYKKGGVGSYKSSPLIK